MTIFSRKTTLAAALAASLAATGALAQAPDTAAAPTCAELGIQRLVLMVPPGRTAEETQRMVEDGTIAPAGTEVVIIPAGRVPVMTNASGVQSRMSSVLVRLVDLGTKMDGTIHALLHVDENGDVTEAHVKTGRTQIDTELERVWRYADFEPYRVGGCRAPAWIDVAFTLSTDFSPVERRIEVRPGEP